MLWGYYADRARRWTRFLQGQIRVRLRSRFDRNRFLGHPVRRGRRGAARAGPHGEAGLRFGDHRVPDRPCCPGGGRFPGGPDPAVFTDVLGPSGGPPTAVVADSLSSLVAVVQGDSGAVYVQTEDASVRLGAGVSPPGYGVGGAAASTWRAWTHSRGPGTSTSGTSAASSQPMRPTMTTSIATATASTTERSASMIRASSSRSVASSCSPWSSSTIKTGTDRPRARRGPDGRARGCASRGTSTYRRRRTVGPALPRRSRAPSGAR